MSTILRLAVIDRGETAVRVLNAVGGLNNSGDAPPITTVLFHLDDPQPWYGREADEVVPLIAAADDITVDDVVTCLERARIDTLWLGGWSPGVRHELIAACERAGIGVVGPSAEVLQRLADLHTIDIPGTVAALPTGARSHIVEVDVLADDHGTVWTIGGRDVSVRLGGVPLFAESPCTIVQGDLGARIRAAAEHLVRQLDYRGAGVVAFAHDGRDIAVIAFDAAAAPDHAVVEERTGQSVIGWRLRIQRGERLPANEPVGEGVVLEARMLAEQPGRVALLSFPVGTGVRIDANRRTGDRVDASDPLIAVISAWGPDRAVALGRLRRALTRTAVVLDGGATNRTTLLGVLAQPALEADDVDDGWLDQLMAHGEQRPPEAVVLLTAAVESYRTDRDFAMNAFLASAARGRPEQRDDVGRQIELVYCGAAYRLDVDQVGPRSYSIRHGATVADITVDALDAFERRVTCGGRRHRLLVAPTTRGFRIEMGDCAHQVDRDDGTIVRAGWPALVVAALVEPGSVVAAGDPIAVLESMKMETTVTAPVAGHVVEVPIRPHAQIERGAPLVRLRTSGSRVPTDAASGHEPRPVDLSGLQQRIDVSRRPCDRVYGPLGDYLLGYDLSAAALHRLLTQQRRLAEIADADDPNLLACEDGLLDIYADLGALYRPQTESEPDDLAPIGENTQEYLHAFLQWLDPDRAGLPDGYRTRLQQALARFGLDSLAHTPELESALTWLFRSFARLAELAPVVTSILQRRLDQYAALASTANGAMRTRLGRLAAATQGRQQAVADLAHDVDFRYFDEPPMEAAATELYAEMAGHLAHLAAHPDSPERSARIERLVWCPHPLRSMLLAAWSGAFAVPTTALQEVILDVHIRRFYRITQLGPITFGHVDGHHFASAEYSPTDARASDEARVHLLVGYTPLEQLPNWADAVATNLDAAADRGQPLVLDLVSWRDGECPDIEATVAQLIDLLSVCRFRRAIQRLNISLTSTEGPRAEHLRTQSATFRQEDGGWVEDGLYRNLHPMLAERLELWRLANFELERRASPEDVYLYRGVARSNPNDQRLFALAEIRELDPVDDPVDGRVRYPRLERTGLLALAAMRSELQRYARQDRPVANRLVLDISAPWTLPAADVIDLANRFAPMAARVGLEKVVLKVRIPDPSQPDGMRDAVLQFEGVGHGIIVHEDQAGDAPVRPLSAYQQKVLTAARFGSPYPFEIVRLLTEHETGPGLPRDTFQELDLDGDDTLVPVQREPGQNTAHLVVGLITNHTAVVPEGMTRVAILSDPTKGLGNLAEPECRRVNAALELALERKVPVEWFAVSSGALISMDSGTENMDWIALTLRRLIEFTQAGGEVNIVVTGINVGGQPYWNAEATMLMHTKGILVMSPASAMVLTGKQALDFSGAVSAEDNAGIGGYDRVMGPNGQAQYWAASFPDACALLLRHYDLTYVVPGERFPRRRPTSDPVDRDVRSSAHALLADCPFTTVGDIFSAEKNPERKQPFDTRSVMQAVADADSTPLERWRQLRDGDTSIVWDTTVGGIPVCMLGIESHTLGRKGFVPSDGPPSWTSGTLFPHSSRKTARAINAASGNRPLVVLANLSGFDGSPESMRRRQLEFGAEIGRAVTNFRGPIVFVVISRYHGGAFVVFSKALNPAMEIAAVEGSYASVIGGAPAAATVFAREVKQRTDRDPRVEDARRALADAAGSDGATLRAALAGVTAAVRSEKLGEVAHEFDAIHTIDRALRVGSVDRIVAACDLRPYVVDALERGMARSE